MNQVKEDKPIVLLVLTGLILILSAAQVYFSVALSIWLPGQFDLPFSDAIWIYLKIPMSLWLVISCLLVLFRQRVGIYLIELATLFAIVYSCWQVINFVYSSMSETFHATGLQLGIMLASIIFWFSLQCFYLWCLRNEKAILYFSLHRA